jgi:hypothetical protein
VQTEQGKLDGSRGIRDPVWAVKESFRRRLLYPQAIARSAQRSGLIPVVESPPGTVHRMRGASVDHFQQVVGHLNARFPGEFECKAGIRGRAQGLEVEATATKARLADTSWKRPIEVDFRRYGIQTPWTV